MPSRRKINIALVGLGLGAAFIPIYQNHPHARVHAICQRRRDRLDAIGEAFGIERRFDDYAAMLMDPEIDAVHINTGIADHAWMTLAALKAGKHAACAAPMAATLADCKKIADAVRASGLRYMMMEAAVHSREHLFIKELHATGKLGKLQFLQASHQQDMDGCPDGWAGLPPMWHATHCVGPLLALAGQPAEYVSCFGSGTLRSGLIKHYESPFAVETTHIKIAQSDLTARVVRSLFDVARQGRESIDVYGTKRSFEWALTEDGQHVLHTAKKPEPKIPERITVPDFAHRLPKAIRECTTTQGGRHSGSYPHLAHEFVSAIVEGRDPFPNAIQSANWTAAGLCAHQSALKGGAIIKLPAWTLG